MKWWLAVPAAPVNLITRWRRENLTPHSHPASLFPGLSSKHFSPRSPADLSCPLVTKWADGTGAWWSVDISLQIWPLHSPVLNTFYDSSIALIACQWWDTRGPGRQKVDDIWNIVCHYLDCSPCWCVMESINCMDTNQGTGGDTPLHRAQHWLSYCNCRQTVINCLGSPCPQPSHLTYYRLFVVKSKALSKNWDKSNQVIKNKNQHITNNSNYLLAWIHSNILGVDF